MGVEMKRENNIACSVNRLIINALSRFMFTNPNICVPLNLGL